MQGMAPFDSVLSQRADPQRTPERHHVRESLRGWRFSDLFRTDVHVPARAAQISAHTPVLDHEGADRAAALQTIIEMGGAGALHAAFDDAFPGCRAVVQLRDGLFGVRVHQRGLLRALARRIVVASSSAQVIVASHASRLIAALQLQAGCVHHVLERDLGGTPIQGLGAFERPAWARPGR